MYEMTTKLLVTISGGLEELAEKQVRSCFPKNELKQLEWHHRGPMGSQLYVTLNNNNNNNSNSSSSEATTTQIIANCLKRLDFVEYVHVLLHSIDINNNETHRKNLPLLLKQVEAETEKIPRASIENLEKLSNQAENVIGASNNHAGVERLPGLLLNPSFQELTNEETPSPPLFACEDFDVNTIYTKPWAAKAVIEIIQQYSNPYLTDESLWLDAGSGNGALLDHLPEGRSIGVDTNPTSNRVQLMDFFKVSKSWLQQRFPCYEKLCVIFNPPFSLSSRGDYTPIVQFINHSFDVLGATVVAVICPSNFARIRIWKSLEMTEKADLMARFLLPQNAFFNPSTGKSVHIHSFCLIFTRRHDANKEAFSQEVSNKAGVYLSSKRDKRLFPHLSTLELTRALVSGFENAGTLQLAAERNAKYMLHAKLSSSCLELWWHVNPQRPCSLMNSNSIRVPNHSLGWISLSCKPPIAMAMCSVALLETKTDSSKSHVAVNLMSGEGTIEVEASRAFNKSFFMISGDKSFDRALKTRKRLQSFKGPRIDIVVWDAQRLPLRKGFADVVLADLPFQGGLKKVHKEPTVGKSDTVTSSALNYSQLLSHACRILKTNGRASLLSPDCNALQHASGGFHWSPLWSSKSINLGGLSGKLFLMERREACTKDVSMFVLPSTKDLSDWILDQALEATATENAEPPLVTSVQLHGTFFHNEQQSLSHCYRIFFDDEIKNAEAKELEKKIRQTLEKKLQAEIRLR